MHYFVGLGDSNPENSTGSSLLGDLDDIFAAVTQQNSVSYNISSLFINFARVSDHGSPYCSGLLHTEVLTLNSQTLDTTENGVFFIYDSARLN